MLKKMFAMMLAMMLCLSMAAAEDVTELPDAFTSSTYADDEGEWMLDLQWYNTGVMFVSVEHMISDTEAEIWSITLENAYDGDTFEYIDAYKGHATLDEEGDALGDVETVYEEGTGMIHMDGDLLTWTDYADNEPHVMALVSASTTTRYTDSVSGAAELSTTTAVEDNSELSCVIEWMTSETETKVWSMTLTWSDADNVYRYSDAVCTKQVSAGDEFALETLYANGTGTFTLMEDGSLVWQDDTDGAGTGCRFVMKTVTY